MRCLVLGYGSIGARHARLLAEEKHDVAVVSRRSDVPYKTFASREDARLDEYDLVVIATATSNHAEDYAFVANNISAKRILLEKPVFLPHSTLL